MKFYKIPINQGKLRSYSGADGTPEIQDNNHDTTFTSSTFRILVDSVGDGSGDARTFDTIFVRCKGANTITVEGMGNAITIPDELPDNQGKLISIIDVYGFHNFLHKHESKITSSVVNITFDKSVEVSELWLLNEDDNIQISNDKRLTQLEQTEIDRGATLRESANNVTHYIPPIGNKRAKSDFVITCRYRPKNNSYQYLKKFFHENKPVFVVAIDYPAEPELVKQYVADPRRQLRYISSYKYAGKDYTFGIVER